MYIAAQNLRSDSKTSSINSDAQTIDIFMKDSEEGEDHYGKKITRNAMRLDGEAVIAHTKLMHIEPVFNKSKIRQSREPTYREVNETLDMFSEKWPEKDINKLVRLLYNNLITSVDNQSQGTKRRLAPRHWQEMKPKQVEEYMNVPKKFRLKNPFKVKKIITKADELLAKHRLIVASSFCNRGYGINYLKQELIQQSEEVIIKRKRYRNIIRAVCVSTYRLLEHFLINECKRNIKPINKYEINALQQIMFNCRLCLKQEELVTFLNFVKISQNLGNVAVPEQAAMKLYTELQTFIRARIGSKHLDKNVERSSWDRYRRKKIEMEYNKYYKQDFQKFMTLEMKEEMMRLYKSHHTPQQLRLYYEKKYPEKKKLFKTSEVHLKINQMLRLSFKKFIFLSKKYERDGVQELIYIDKRDSKLIYNHSEGLNIRFQLIDLYFDSETNIINRLQRLSFELNTYLTQKINERLSYTIENVATDPVIKKLEYNINVSNAKNAEKHRYYAREDNVILKGKERNYNHFINVTNDQNIHYYRKCDQNQQQQSVSSPTQPTHSGQIKIQEPLNDSILGNGSQKSQVLTALQSKQRDLLTKDKRLYKNKLPNNYEQIMKIDKNLLKRLQIQVKEPVYSVSKYEHMLRQYVQRISLDFYNIRFENER